MQRASAYGGKVNSGKRNDKRFIVGRRWQTRECLAGAGESHVVQFVRMQSTARKQPQVIIVGAGFGGLEAAKKLACEDVRVTLIDRTNYHLFQPLLYQVATAALSPADIAAPVRAILSKCRNVEVILAEVESVDVEARKVKTKDRVFDYDYLILATGARHSYFGHDEWEKLAPGLKSLEDAVELRRRILLAFEYAEKTNRRSRAQGGDDVRCHRRWTDWC